MRPRLRPLVPDELNEEQRRLYGAIVGGTRKNLGSLVDGNGGLRGPFNALLYTPVVGDAIQTLGAALRDQSSLARRAQELVILASAVAFESEFEWNAHERLAQKVGWDAVQVQAVKDGREPSGAGPVELTALRTAVRLLANGDLDDGEYEQAERVLGPGGVVEVAALIGYYGLIALQLRLFRVSLEMDAGSNAREP